MSYRSYGNKKGAWPLFVVSLVLIFNAPAFAEEVSVAELLFEQGEEYFEQDNYEEALREFKKALLANPEHAQALAYIEIIEQKQGLVEEEIALSPLERFDSLLEEINEKISPAKISGEFRMALGVDSQDLTGKFADADLAERNWRYLSSAQERFNAFDPAIYSRFKLDVETDTYGAIDGYLSLVIDPWSFRGTSRKVDIESLSTPYDAAQDVQLKYFSSNRRTINETYRTVRGDSLGINEMKVIDDWTTTEIRPSVWRTAASTSFYIPDLEIDREFMPIRKLWFDFGEVNRDLREGIKLRLFPWASAEQALTTDDPLVLSNRHNYWEPSPWIWEWEQHKVFTANSALKPGKWSDTLAFRARDSENYHLTYLRGASLEAQSEQLSLQTTVGLPLSPWDDYQVVNNIPGALRLKWFPYEEVMFGSTYTFRAGFAGGREDVTSHTAAVDTEVKMSPQVSLRGQAALSKVKADQTSEDKQWQDEDTGQAYKAEVIFGDEQGASFIETLELKLGATYMGKDFSAPLSHYLQTRDDLFWGKHITFAQALADYEPFRIGDGIDVDRYVAELDLRSKLFEEDLELLFNLRNVHRVSNDKYLETVFRNEGTYKINPKLTAKWLVIRRDLHDTHADLDPLIVDSEGEPFLNYDIEDGKDPSTATAGLGLKYDFTDKISLQGIYECSNDLPDFPRALLNNTAFIGTETEGGIVYDNVGSQLYSQGFFPLPPYDYFNIYKAKLALRPREDLTLRLNYTRNTFEYAGPIDDNINHGALEVDYDLSEKLAFSFRYVYAKFIDVYRQNLGEGIHYDGHHNFYFETRYDIDENKRLSVQYGTFGAFNPAAGEYATSWSLATVDTEHLLRIVVTGKF